VSGSSLYASIRRGSSDVAGYTLYVNGVEQSGISLGGDGLISGFTLKTEDTSVIKFVITDAAGYSATAEITVKAATPPKTDEKEKAKD
jgi:hypothetical protein